MLRAFSGYVLRSRPSQGSYHLMFSTNPAFRADDKAEAVTRQSFPSPPLPTYIIFYLMPKSQRRTRSKMGDALVLRPRESPQVELMAKRKWNLITVLSSLSSLSDILGYTMYLYRCAFKGGPDSSVLQYSVSVYVFNHRETATQRSYRKTNPERHTSERPFDNGTGLFLVFNTYNSDQTTRPMGGRRLVGL